MDRLDYKIIEALVENGRATNVELSQKVNLSQSQCMRRVKTLEEFGVITGYKAVLDQEKMGNGLTAWVLISISTSGSNVRDAVIDFLQNEPKVHSVFGLTGDVDFLAEVHTKDMAEFSQLLVKKINKSDGIVSTKSFIQLDAPKMNGISRKI